MQPKAVLARTVVVGTTSGVLLVAADLAVGGDGRAHVDASAAIYAAALCVVAATIPASVAAVLLAVGTMIRSPWRRAFVIGLPIAGAFVPPAATLFDGPWIRAQSWRYPAEIGFLTLAVIGILATSRLLIRRPWARRGLAFLIGIAIAGVGIGSAWSNASILHSYPAAKWLFTLATWISAAVLLGRGLDRLRPRPAIETALAVVVVVAAAFAGAALRGAESIHRTRALITGTPLAATARLMSSVEAVLFDRLKPLPTFSAGAIDVKLESGADRAAVQKELDRILPGRAAFNVLWIAIDALRADHLSCHGYVRKTSPRLDQLASQSVWFTRAVSPASASDLTYGAVLKGIYPRATKTYELVFNAPVAEPAGASIAERMQAAGRRTAAVTSFHGSTMERPNFALLGKGFDSFNARRGAKELVGDETTAEALRLIDEATKTPKPFFAWAHYIDPHGPYFYHDEFDYGKRPIDAYDSEISYCDRAVGRLLDGLTARGLDRNTVVVLFADHGEAFGEHNMRWHGTSLHEHQVRVPLMIRVPGLPHRRVDRWVDLTAIAPTTLALLGIDDPVKRLGRDLTAQLLGIADDAADAAYAERPAGPNFSPPAYERAVWFTDKKLVWRPAENTVHVFDLAADPGELQNIFDPGSEEHQRLFGLLKAFDARIDAFGGAAGAQSRPADSAAPVERFKRAVAAVTAAADGPEAALDQALADAAQTLVDAPYNWDVAAIRALPRAELDRLVDAAAKRAASITPAAKSFAPVLRILLVSGRADVAGAAVTLVEKSRNPFWIERVAHFRAGFGDKSALPILEQALDAPGTDLVEVARSLALLGRTDLAPILEAALDHDKTASVIAAIEGLRGAGNGAPLDWLLFTDDKRWRNPKLLMPLLEAARADRSGRGIAALLQLVNLGDRETAAPARAEFESRLLPKPRVEAERAFEALFGVRDAARYWMWDTAVQAASTLTANDDQYIGSSWWLVAQCALRAGDQALYGRALERLKAAMPAGDPMIDVAAAMLAAKGARLGLKEENLNLSAKIVGGMGSIRKGQTFAARLSVSNGGAAYVPGGPFPDNLWLGWAFDKETVPTAARRLPLGGLGPQATIEFVVLGSWPKSPGTYDARLRLFHPSRPKKAVTILEVKGLIVP